MTDAFARLAAALADRYRIERELGEGGMATVYLARDLKHDRDVAIKVLKPELAAVLGAERFVQEIATTAHLQHPNILPLFDSGSADGFLYYVMPYVEGESLRTRLDRERQLGVEEAVKLVVEVADALEYAHDQGVVHRDIKPENILLHAGRPMVADFGIALAVSAAAGGRMTETGLSLGTPHYMSPEQATAEKDITGRSDIYSLASVLYEMLTGDPPHTARSAQQILVKIIAEEARPLGEARKSVPPNVAAAVAKALEKLPADRFETAKAFADALLDPGFWYVAADARGPAAGASAPASARSVVAAWLPWGVAVAALAVAGWSLLRPAAPPAARAPVRMVLSGFDVENTPGGGPRVAISQNGATLVAGGPGGLLYVRRLSDDTTFRPIPGTHGARHPSISPDGAWVVFHQGNGLAKVLLSGGPVLPVAKEGSTPDWYSRDSILYGGRDGIRVVGAGGGLSRLVSKGSIGRTEQPFMLPDHRGILYEGKAGIYLLDLTTGKSSLLEEGGSGPRYLPTGHLLYGDRYKQAVFAVPFDLKTHTITGTPVPVLPSVLIFSGGAVQLTVSSNGTLVYVAGQGLVPQTGLAWIDTAGATTPLQLNATVALGPWISHDGTRIAYTDKDRHSFVYNLSTGARTEVADSAGGIFPVWSPDDSDIYTWAPDSTGDIWYRQSADGVGKPEIVATGMTGPIVGGSSDGKWIVSENLVGSTSPDIYIARTDTLPFKPKPYLRADWKEVEPAVSPDGRWMAYVSNQTGTDEVYVRSFPVPGPAARISTDGGREPMWDPRGSALYYVSSSTLVRADLRVGRTVSVRGRKRLFPVPPYSSGGFFRGVDISPDGTRFLVNQKGMRPLVEASSGTQPAGIGTVFVVVNWFTALKARMAVAAP